MKSTEKNRFFCKMNNLLKKQSEMNLFECFDENAHSKFLVYLFKKYPKLLKNFLKLIQKNTEEIETENCTIINQYENIDIFIELKDSVFVIEVKLDAKFSVNNDKCQLETYYDKITKISIRTSLADYEINEGLYNIPLYDIGNVSKII